jgi:DNA invertase Pin-like site-specific DNA recombinase
MTRTWGRLTNRSDLSGLPGIMLTRKSNPNPQNPDKSIEDQTTDLEAEFERRGIVEVARFEEPETGASAYSRRLFRQKFESALELVRTTDIAVLAWWDLSRSTRRVYKHAELMELLELRNTLLLVGGRLFDCADPQDRQTLDFMAVMNQAQVMNSRAGTKRGLEKSAKAGRPHGVEIYGYRRRYDPSTRRLLSVDIYEPEAEIIREIVRRVIGGDSQGSIARDLTSRGIPRWRTATWYTGEIRDIIDRDAYMGTRTHVDWSTKEKVGSYKAMWPAIVTEEEMRLARAALNARNAGKGGGGPRVAKYMLTGIISCGRCGGAVYGDTPAAMGRHEYNCRKCRLSRAMEPTDIVVRDAVATWMGNRQTVARLASAESGGLNAELEVKRAELQAAEQELDQAYKLGLSARGLKAMEDQWLPTVDRLKLEIAKEEREIESSGWEDVRTGKIARIPENVADARDVLRRLVRVELLPLGRGQRFHPECIRVTPIGAAKQS